MRPARPFAPGPVCASASNRQAVTRPWSFPGCGDGRIIRPGYQASSQWACDMSELRGPSCRSDRPVSVVLGAGAVRGMAHIGVLETLQAAGFQITELIGTSV